MMQKNTVKKSPSFFKEWSVMSLRNRIAFYYTIMTAFLIALVFAVIYFTVEHIVYRQFDEEIKKKLRKFFQRQIYQFMILKGFRASRIRISMPVKATTTMITTTIMIRRTKKRSMLILNLFNWWTVTVRS